MKKISYTATLVVFSFFLSSTVYAASFDCTKATLQAEKTICANEYLSALDSIMSDFYNKVRQYSLNEKALSAQQKQWWQERNKCNEDTKCLQKTYQERIESLESEYKWIAFKPIEQSRLAYVLERQGKAPLAETHTDFIAKDNYWDVRPFYSSYSALEDVLKKEYDFHPKVSARITLEGYRFDQGVLYLYATFWYPTPNRRFLVELTDHLPPKIITKYTEGDFLIPGTPKKTWLGMCGSDTCYSYHASPNNIWQVATKIENDAIYLFPNNKPNEGQMIIENFNPNIRELNDEGGNMDRNVVWLDDNTLFFDNATAYVCIWRVDIEKKLVEKIIPFHDVQIPFPIKLNNEEYLPFVITHSNDSSSIYLARPPQKKIEASSN